VLEVAAGFGLIGLVLLCIVGLINPPPEVLVKAGIIICAIGSIIFFLVAIPAVVAYVYCLFSPNKRGAMAWAIVVLSLGGVSLVLRIIWMLIPAINSFSIFSGRGDQIAAVIGTQNSVSQIPIVLIMGGRGAFGQQELSIGGTITVSLVVLLVMYAEYVVLPIYMRAAGIALSDRYASRPTVVPLVFAAVGVGLKVIALIVAFAGEGSVRAEAGPRAAIIIIAILTLLAHAAFVVYGSFFLQLSMKTRQAIDRRD